VIARAGDAWIAVQLIRTGVEPIDIKRKFLRAQV
jgi:hypothetical protein